MLSFIHGLYWILDNMVTNACIV